MASTRTTSPMQMVKPIPRLHKIAMTELHPDPLVLQRSDARLVRINFGGRGAKDIYCNYRESAIAWRLVLLCFPIVCALQPILRRRRTRSLQRTVANY